MHNPVSRFLDEWSINTVINENDVPIVGIIHICQWTEWTEREDPTIDELYNLSHHHECKETS